MLSVSKIQSTKYLKNKQVYVLFKVQYGVSLSVLQPQQNKDLIERIVTSFKTSLLWKYQ